MRPAFTRSPDGHRPYPSQSRSRRTRRTSPFMGVYPEPLSWGGSHRFLADCIHGGRWLCLIRHNHTKDDRLLSREISGVSIRIKLPAHTPLRKTSDPKLCGGLAISEVQGVAERSKDGCSGSAKRSPLVTIRPKRSKTVVMVLKKACFVLFPSVPHRTPSINLELARSSLPEHSLAVSGQRKG